MTGVPVPFKQRARPRRGGRRPMTFARWSMYGFFALVVLSWGYIFGWTDSGAGDLLSGDSWSNSGRFLRQLAGQESEAVPAFAKADRWRETAKLAYDTLVMSVLAIGMTGLAAFPTFVFGARNVSSGELGGAQSKSGVALFYAVRLTFAVTRAVPELVWAMVIVFFLSPGVLPGAVALALHNYGVLGKLSSEVVENLDPGPARALRASGAGSLQMLLYAVLPQALPSFLTYLLYRWEVIIRTTVVVGFVAAGGLGREFRLSISLFHYTDVALIIAWYLILVVAVDLASAGLRRLVSGE